MLVIMGNVTDSSTIRLLIADDDPMVCQSLTLLLTQGSHGLINVVATCHDGQEAVETARDIHPDVALLDLDMPVMDGISATRGIKSTDPSVHVLILTSVNPRNNVERAIEEGAEGFISKADDITAMVGYITEANAGHPQFSTSSNQQLLEDMREIKLSTRQDEARRLLYTLPQRERETVVYAAQGLSNQEIALRMCISERTVKAHLTAACDKLCMNRVMLARLVERAGL